MRGLVLNAVALLEMVCLGSGQMNPPLPKCQMGLIWPNGACEAASGPGGGYRRWRPALDLEPWVIMGISR